MDIKLRSAFKNLGLITGLGLLMLLQGCETGYYFHLAKGQTQLLSSRVATEKILLDKETSPKLKARLELTRDILLFAEHHLKLPLDGQYSTYVLLNRPYAIWSVSAAPELSLEPYQWCYMFVGCAHYRGYFDPVKAHKTAAQLQEQGYETAVRGISAYSTLGWFEDPILSSFDRYPDDSYIELLFHELAHAQLYISDNTTFNESFATFVGRQGLKEFHLQASPSTSQQKNTAHNSEIEFKKLILRYKKKLNQTYQSNATVAQKKHNKALIYTQLKDEYNLIKQTWSKPNAYDQWMASVNNAHIMVFSDYESMIPTFADLFQQCNEKWDCFYSAAQALAKKGL